MRVATAVALTLTPSTTSPTYAEMPIIPELPANIPSAMCQTDGRVLDILYHNNTYYLAGLFDNVRPPGVAGGGAGEVSRTGLAACNATTGAVLAWNPIVTHTTPASLEVVALAIAPDGNTLFVGGRFTHINGSAHKNVAAFTLASGLLASWDATPDPSKVLDIEITSDGATIYTSGWNGIKAYTTAGTAVAGFAPDIRQANNNLGTVQNLALSHDGQQLYFGGGNFTIVNGVAREGAAAVDAASGTNTHSFDPDIVDTNPNDMVVQIYDIVIADDTIYLCGDWWLTEGLGEEDPGGRQRNVGRFDPISGAADLAWLPWTDGGVQGCDIDPVNDLLIIGGHFDKVGSFIEEVADVPFTRDIAALNLSTGQVAAWRPGTNGTAGIYAVTVAAGKVALGGEFTQTGGVNQEGVAVYDLERTAILVVEDPLVLNDGDTAVAKRLEQQLGFQVTLIDDDTAVPTDADNVDLVLISATVSSGTLGSTFKTVNTPVLTWKAWLYDEMGLTGSNNGVDQGTTSNLIAIEIVNATHPLAAGRSGIVPLVTTQKTFAWGLPGAAAQVVAKLPGSDQAVLFAYQSGDLLADGTTAAGCRIALPAYKRAPAFFTQAGWAIFDTAVTHAVNDCDLQDAVLFVVDDAAALNTADTTILSRLENELGLIVTVISDEVVTMGDANAKAMVLISSSASSTTLGTMFTAVAVPVITWKPWLYDNLALTGLAENVDYGTLADQQTVIIENPIHPLSAGLTGDVTIVTAPKTFSWGVPAATGQIVARGSNGKPLLFAYQTGDILADGSVAPACRIALPGTYSAPTFFTTAGWALFDTTMQVAMGGCDWMPPFSLSISPSFPDVLLEWQDYAAFRYGYVVYWADTPYFEPDKLTLWQVLAPGSTLVAHDLALGDPNLNHFYIAKAIGSNAVVLSNRVGEFDFTIQSGN